LKILVNLERLTASLVVAKLCRECFILRAPPSKDALGRTLLERFACIFELGKISDVKESNEEGGIYTHTSKESRHHREQNKKMWRDFFTCCSKLDMRTRPFLSGMTLETLSDAAEPD
jgi:hypothetical protein